MIEKSFIASFDVDAQNCFTPLCPDELPVPGGDEIADALNEQAAFSQYRIGSKDAHNVKAIWVADDNNPQLNIIENEKNVDLRWNAHAIVGTKGFELISSLPSPAEYDYFIWKGIELNMHPYGACFHDLAEQQSTGAIEFLNSKHIKLVIVGGLALEYCVKTTVLQLLKNNFSVILNLSSSRSLNADDSLKAVTEMKNCGAHIIKKTNEISKVINSLWGF